MILDNINNIDIYKDLNPDIYAGLQFLKNVNLDIELGEYPITEKAFARVLAYETKVENDFGFEAHQHVIDIQFPIIGRELVKWANLSQVKAYTGYDSVKDVTLFKSDYPESVAIIGQGIFGIFFPTDAHAPEHCVVAPEMIKKIVVKVKC